MRGGRPSRCIPASARTRRPRCSRASGASWPGVALTLGLAQGPASAATAPYDPELYRAVYQHVLRRRHADLLRVHAILPASAMSPYDLGVSVDDLLAARRRSGAADRWGGP